jgi:hypothetical protein
LLSHPAKQYEFPVIVPRISLQWKRVWEISAVVRMGMETVSLIAAMSWAVV